MSPTEFSNYIKQRAMQKNLQQQNSGFSQQQNNGFYDKFYSPTSPCYNSGNSNGSNMNNFNNFPKSLASPGGGSATSDYNNFGLGSSCLSNASNGFSNSSSGLNLSDYSSLLSDWPDVNDLDTNAFLQDILSSAGVGGSGPAPKSTTRSQGLLQPSYDDWVGGSVGLSQGFNANHAGEAIGLGPESRSSSTKSMSSGSEHSLPSPPGLGGSEGRSSSSENFGAHRVLVANWLEIDQHQKKEAWKYENFYTTDILR